MTTAVLRNTTACISAQDAELSPTALANVLALRKRLPKTPYKAEAWEQALRQAELLERFSFIPLGLHKGFVVGYPTLAHVQTPPNSTSLSVYKKEFEEIVNKELTKKRYIGPLPFATIEAAIGPFQSSPLSLIPKPGKPGKFRLVQNFSFPIQTSPRFPNPSINSAITADLIPCTWGKFSTIFLLIARLPPGSQAATRDVAEAYRTIPLHESQWPAAVVRTSENTACIDTCVAFGASPSCGAYGQVADAGAEILRANGVGPLDKWVDDHIFFRILRVHMHEYNLARQRWHADIMVTGIQHTASRIWFGGVAHQDGSIEEFNENCSVPIKDLSDRSRRSEEDITFTYNFTDIDDISENLGIPWEVSKDQPFASLTIYIGFVWNIAQRTVAISPAKTEKYIGAINDWLARHKHTLKNVQELYGKLLHAASVLPQGRAYLTGLESMLSTCAKKPFVPHRPDTGLNQDLGWWLNKLKSGAVIRPIQPPPLFLDLRAFSDASSGFGIGIIIGERWRAWRLRPDWSTFHGKKDIGWAEAVGFELLIRAIDVQLPDARHVILHGDNTGIVEGWCVSRHRNRAVNAIFKHIHSFLESANHVLGVATRYVPSENNPADQPSRGIYGAEHHLLPPIQIPEHLRDFLTDASNPLSARELRELREGRYSSNASRTLARLRAQQEATERTLSETQFEDELINRTLQTDRF